MVLSNTKFSSGMLHICIYSFTAVVLEISEAGKTDNSDITKPMIDAILDDNAADAKHEVPSSVNVTESESIGSNLVQMKAVKSDNRPSKKPQIDEFVLPVKPHAAVARKTEQKKNRKETGIEMPSLADIKVLHARRKETPLKQKINIAVHKDGAKTTATENTKNASLAQTVSLKSGAKKGEVGSLGDEMHNHSSTLKSEIGDLGNLGTSTAEKDAVKSEEAAWKRKFGDVGLLTEQPKNPETPSVSDIGELSTFKKEIAAAVKGLGPEATIMTIKKSHVPKPHKRYWGINTMNGNEEIAAGDRQSNRRKYWGVNVMNKEKDNIPGKNFVLRPIS